MVCQEAVTLALTVDAKLAHQVAQHCQVVLCDGVVRWWRQMIHFEGAVVLSSIVIYCNMERKEEEQNNNKNKRK